MDEMKLKLQSKFMKGIVTKIISKVIYNKLGCKIDIQLNEIQLENKDGKMHIHVDIDGDMENEEFAKLIKGIGLD